VKFARVGLIVNPHAGRGDGLALARRAIYALSPREVWVGGGEMGADALGGLVLERHLIDWSEYHGKARTAFIAHSIVNETVDALVVVGGDGTMADVALALLSSPAPQGRLGGGGSIPILGIGVGSANAGPLVTIHAAQIQRLVTARLKTRAVEGLIAGANDVDLGLGFNDVVIDFTVLATVNDQVINVDAAHKMNGANVPRQPEPVFTTQTKVMKQSPHSRTLVAEGDQVVTLITGLPDERFYGKAIAGGAILSSFVGDTAGCLVCSHLLVTTYLDADALHRAEPIVSRYVGLNEADRIEVSGLRKGVALCADGNPLKILDESDRVQIRVQCGLATSVRIEESS
jgi:NAD kinase